MAFVIHLLVFILSSHTNDSRTTMKTTALLCFSVTGDAIAQPKSWTMDNIKNIKGSILDSSNNKQNMYIYSDNDGKKGFHILKCTIYSNFYINCKECWQVYNNQQAKKFYPKNTIKLYYEHIVEKTVFSRTCKLWFRCMDQAFFW